MRDALVLLWSVPLFFRCLNDRTSLGESKILQFDIINMYSAAISREIRIYIALNTCQVMGDGWEH